MEVAEENIFICDKHGIHIGRPKPNTQYEWLKEFSSDGKKFRLIRNGIINYIGKSYWVNLDGDTIGKWQNKIVTPPRPNLTLVK